MIAELWGKAWGYIVAFGALVLAILGAIFYGREKGKAAMQPQIDNANANAAAATSNETQVESRHETDATVQNLPTAPAQTVGDALPSTAAGKLRDDGFLRD